jgi:hypothetical protein
MLSFVTPLSAADFRGTINKFIDGDTFWICDQSACHKRTPGYMSFSVFVTEPRSEMDA